MKLLLDTHLLLWAAAGEGLSDAAVEMLENAANTLLFSAASIWEVAIKAALGRHDFAVDAALLRHELFNAGYQELPISGAHAAAVADLPYLHRDPFDRLLIVQAISERVTLLTVDKAVLRYPGPIRSAA